MAAICEKTFGNADGFPSFCPAFFLPGEIWTFLLLDIKIVKKISKKFVFFPKKKIAFLQNLC